MITVVFGIFLTYVLLTIFYKKYDFELWHRIFYLAISMIALVVLTQAVFVPYDESVSGNENITRNLTVMGNISASGGYFSNLTSTGNITASWGSFSENVSASFFVGDGSNLTLVNADLLDGKHSTEFAYDDGTNIIASKPLKRTNEGYIFVPRGDAPFDYTQTTLTIGSEDDLDLSGIVSATATAVKLWIYIQDASSNQQFWVKKKGNTNIDARVRTQSGVTITDAVVTCELDANKVITYSTSAGLDYFGLKVVGWYE